MLLRVGVAECIRPAAPSSWRDGRMDRVNKHKKVGFRFSL